MEDTTKCPPSYETYIDIFRSGYVKYVVWFFFRKLTASGIAECKNCHDEIIYGNDTVLLIDHLKSNHYSNEGSGFSYSYENYFQHLKQSLEGKSYDFPEVNNTHLKLTFGVRYDEKFTLVRFPQCRKGRTIYPEKNSYKSDWQKQVCQTYSDNPVGSYQGHFDRPMSVKVYTGSAPLSFKEYTEFTHTPKDSCNKYEIDLEKYEKLDDLKKIEALKVMVDEDPVIEHLVISGTCSRDDNQRLLYTCIKHSCVLPCVCKDCVLDDGQCEDHEILHPGYFDEDNHAMTVRMHDSHNINLVQDDFAFEAGRIVEVIKYPGIEKDPKCCGKCPRDLFHHQAYHFVHHEFCKFCKNEKHKIEDVVSKKAYLSRMNERHNLEQLSCHICNKLYESHQSKNNHVQTQHEHDVSKGIKCEQCDRIFNSKQAVNYHKKVNHLEEPEEHQCPVCDKIFNTRHSLDVHSRSVHNLRKVYCKKCLTKFTRQSNLLRHYKLVHDLDLKKYYHDEENEEGLELQYCDQCDFKTIYKSNLKHHVEYLHSLRKDTLNCDQCSFQTVYKRNLTRHVLKVHAIASEEKTKYSCELCDFSTEYSDNLRRHTEEQHVQKSRKKKLFLCDRCEFYTFNEETLTFHKENFPH